MKRNLILAMVKKDLMEFRNNRMAFLPILLVPIIILVVLPTVFFIAIYFGSDQLAGSNMQQLKTMMSKFPEALPFTDDKQNMVYMMLNFMFPAFFLMIPIMCSSILGAASFVGEREHKTMESLLYSPLSIRELFFAKLIGCFVPAYMITLISFLVFGVVVDTGGFFFFQRLIFPDLKWMILLFWLTPAVSLFSLGFIVFVSAKCETYIEAQQYAGFLIVPFLFLFIGQTSGLFLLNIPVLLILGLVLFIGNYFMVRAAAGRFNPEKLV